MAPTGTTKPSDSVSGCLGTLMFLPFVGWVFCPLWWPRWWDWLGSNNLGALGLRVTFYWWLAACGVTIVAIVITSIAAIDDHSLGSIAGSLIIIGILLVVPVGLLAFGVRKGLREIDRRTRSEGVTKTLRPDFVTYQATCAAASGTAAGGSVDTGPMVHLPAADKKTIIFSGSTLHPLSFSLPPALLATGRNDVRYIGCLDQNEQAVGTYSEGGTGYKYVWEVSIVDRVNREAIASRRFEGGDPPSAKMGSGNGYGTEPISNQLLKWVSGTIAGAK